MQTYLKGSVRVNMQVRKNHVEIHDSQGARRELLLRALLKTERSGFTLQLAVRPFLSPLRGQHFEVQKAQ
jgi:hypothetical protein